MPSVQFYPRVVWHRLLSFCLAGALALSVVIGATSVQAKGALPEPYVSQALDVVLMPVTKEVRSKFKLGKKAAGAVVVSVQPGGIGELYGFEPGDVISQVDGKLIRRPVDVDSMVRYWLNKGNSYFTFDGTRKNRKKRAIVEIAAEVYQQPVALETVGRWRGYTSQSFNYIEYYTYYEPRFYEIYEYSTYYVEQVIITETYITAIESTETVFYYDTPSDDLVWHDEDYITEVNEYVYSEEFYSEYTSTEVYYDDQPEAQVYEDQGYEDPATDEQVPETYDDASQDEAYAEPEADQAYEEPADDQSYEDPMQEESYEEPLAEEPAYEEPAPEEPAPEEPAYEEPAPEEPAYEEPAYEEPAQDSGDGGECYYDDEGNLIC